MTAPSMVDWGEAWRVVRAGRSQGSNDQAHWDRRAQSFKDICGRSPYGAAFLGYADILPDESVFDMGCGAGTLSIPLAQMGHEVVAADFSENMLRYLRESAREKGVDDRIRTVRLDWMEDWAPHRLERCDVAVASRSIITDDLEDSLLKLDAMARRRACVTVPTKDSPRTDDKVLRAIGRAPSAENDVQYCLNILFQHGMAPELRYISTERRESWGSREDAVSDIRRSLGVLIPAEEKALASFLDEFLVEGLDGEATTCWRKGYVQPVIWAFIAWDKETRQRESV